MYDVKPNLVIGFHGCDRAIRDQLLNKPDDIVISKKPFDWLGHGMYFWENNYTRALQWAESKMKRGAINTPAVIGAVLYLGYCCDFLETKYIRMLQGSYSNMAIGYKIAGKELPRNKDLPHDKHHDKILRELDCAVIEKMHQAIVGLVQSEIKENGFSDHKVFDSTRGVFVEGGPAFEGAGIFEKSHIQICIRNLNCIKGFFLPRQEIDFPEWLEKNKAAA
jgi:hypothetical protein